MKDEMGRTYNANGGQEKCIQNISQKTSGKENTWETSAMMRGKLKNLILK
jgi:hypothetical protein